ncbi:550_t:CDS:2, partial [Acaulospora morrowiae]
MTSNGQNVEGKIYLVNKLKFFGHPEKVECGNYKLAFVRAWLMSSSYNHLKNYQENKINNFVKVQPKRTMMASCQSKKYVESCLDFQMRIFKILIKADSPNSIFIPTSDDGQFFHMTSETPIIKLPWPP